MTRMWRGAVIVLAVVAGCAVEGRPIRAWTLDIDGRHVEVTLPSNLSDALPLREVDYTLRADVPLQPEQRGRPLALVVDCFHGPLTLTANGTPIADTGGGSRVGSWRFVLPPALTGDPLIALVFAIHRDAQTGAGFGIAPRLTDDPDGDPRGRGIATFNRYAPIAALCFVLLLGVLYVALFLLDRRSEYAAMIVQCVTVTNVPLMQLGVYYYLLGRAGTSVFVLVSVINFGGLIYFLHSAFGLGRIHRGWFVLLGAFGLAALASMGSFRASLGVFLGHSVLTLVVNGYFIARLVRVARRGEHRHDARLMLAAYLVAGPCIVQGIVWWLSGANPLGGAHPFPVAIVFYAALQVVVLGRQHVARKRAIDAANTELRHQVAERSRELGDALARLAQQAPQPMGEGRTIDGRYRIIDKLGAGGMGTVYAVERVADQRRFALKTLRGRGEPDAMARFAREAQIAAEIEHPNLVPVLDVGIADGALFLVMPLVDGGSVEQQRARFGDAKWAGPILAQTAAGLLALHQRGIVHRDLKPANILLSGGVARIADFGLASLAARGPQTTSTIDPALDDTRQLDPALTVAGDIFGTPLYMAPELASGVRDVKPSSDVFAFGLVAYELLTGRRAFAESPMMARLNGVAIPPPAMDVVPAAMRALVGRCLDLEPANRPSAAELVGELAG